MPQDWDTILANELSGKHIGTLIRFRRWDTKHYVVTVVTAELRQVNHDLGGPGITVGEGGEVQYQLADDQPVILNPKADYSDCDSLVIKRGINMKVDSEINSKLYDDRERARRNEYRSRVRGSDQ